MTTETETSTGNESSRPWIFLWMSACMGFLIGFFVFPRWADNVESAQVVAGVVQLPLDNPMYLYHTSVYSLLIQSAGILLSMGLSEWHVCMLFSGLQAAICFTAVSACTLAFARNGTIALLTPLLYLWLRQAFPTWPMNYLEAFHGHKYPILFPNHTSLYGVCGLFGSLLALSLLSLNYKRSAAFLLGILPGIHITMGMACWIATGTALLFQWKIFRADLKPFLKWLGIGFAVFAVTFSWHLAHQKQTIVAPPGLVEAYSQAFDKYWDDHRMVNWSDLIPLFEPEYYLVPMAILLLTVFRSQLTIHSRIVLVGLLTISVIGISYQLISCFFPDSIPLSLKRIMITRWLNLNSIAFPLIAIGILGNLAANRQNIVAWFILIACSILVILQKFNAITAASYVTLQYGNLQDKSLLMRGALFPVILVCSAILLSLLDKFSFTPRLLVLNVGWNKWISPLILVALIGGVSVFAVQKFDAKRFRGVDSYSVVFDRLREGDRLFISSAEMYLWDAARLQLRSRRGVLLDLTQLNMISYVPKAGPSMENILNKIYGVSLRDPSAGAPLGALRERWEQKSLEEWQAIREEFNVSNILTEAGWQLQLPQIASAESCSLFYIPPPEQLPSQNPLQ